MGHHHNYDDPRDRAHSGGGDDYSRDSRSRPDSPHRHRDHRRTEGTSHARRHSRDRSRDRHRENTSEVAHSRSGVDDLIPRYRESRGHEHRDESHRSSKTLGRERPGSPSESLGKRARSRSRSHSRSYHKSSRRDRSMSRRSRDGDEDRDARKRHRHSSHRERKHSPRSSSRRSRSPGRKDEPRTSRRERSRSPAAATAGSRHSRDSSRYHELSDARQNSRPISPGGGRSPQRFRPQSRDRRPLSPGPRPREPARDRGFDLGPSERPPPPLSPPSRHRQPRADLPERALPPRSNLEDDMAPRAAHRGYSQPHSHKAHYENDRSHYNDSPQHGNSHHPSPSRSPYSSSRGRSGPNKSPPSQHPPQHPAQDRGFGPPKGPAAHFASNHQAPPTGPQYSHTNFRGGPRGNGFRGSFTGRGGRGEPSNGMARTGANAVGLPERDSADGQVADSEQPANSDSRPTPVPNRAPPTGPAAHNNASSKFSFAFKASSKPAAAPKPEISQKFNAIAKNGQLPSAQDREPPPSAPTGPRGDGGGPDALRIAPRMRKVKKIMKRLKQRPALPADLAGSDSVFYRKPGNESVVGSGTYGKVFKGLNVYTKGQVALKRIRMEGERDGFPVTAVREIKLLQSLRHTNIVNLQEVMVEKNDCFMVFEYLSHDLTGLINHPSFKLEPAQKKHFSKQLFEGLDYLHTRGVLHRDIKAANILVSSDGILKLADFGLARFYAKRHQLDYTNRVITIWYRSPELLLGETQYTAAVDVWSAACVMVEIFTRNAIFPGEGTELSQLTKIYDVLGTPSRQQWPGLVDMAWFELLRPKVKKRSTFAERYQDRVSPAAFDLLEAMFLYDPTKRPTAAQVLQHAYFTVEEPQPRQAIELANIDGEWHEFESKALRKENQRKAREASKADGGAAASVNSNKGDREKKRMNENQEASQRDAKRVHVE